MIEKEKFLKGVSRCEIFFEGERISDECIVKDAINFIAGCFYDQSTRRRALLHTGSISYDAVAVFLSAVADVLVFYVKNEGFLANLKPGDIVIDTQCGKRLRREVTAVKFGESIELLVLSCWKMQGRSAGIQCNGLRLDILSRIVEAEGKLAGQAYARQGLRHEKSSSNMRSG